MTTCTAENPLGKGQMPNAIPSAIARLDRVITDTTERLHALESLLGPILSPDCPPATEKLPLKREITVPLAEVIQVMADSASGNLGTVEELISRVQI